MKIRIRPRPWPGTRKWWPATVITAFLAISTSSLAQTLNTNELFERALAARNEGAWTEAAMYLFAYVQRDPEAMQRDAEHRRQVYENIDYFKRQPVTDLETCYGQLQRCQGSIGSTLSYVRQPPPRLDEPAAPPRASFKPRWEIACPVNEARREVTTRVPDPWWSTPVVASLMSLRVSKDLLICEYGWENNVEAAVLREAPEGSSECAIRGREFWCR